MFFSVAEKGVISSQYKIKDVSGGINARLPPKKAVALDIHGYWTPVFVTDLVLFYEPCSKMIKHIPVCAYMFTYTHAGVNAYCAHACTCATVHTDKHS